MSSRCARIVVTACALSVVATISTAQGRGNPNPLRMITKTIYTPRTEWDGRFLTTPASMMVLASGKTPTLAVSKGAIVQIEGQPHVYVQRDPEAFYVRLVNTGEGNDRYVAVIDGVREGERVVTRGAEKMPRK